MKYRAEYDAKTKKMRIFVDDLPANQYEFAKIICGVMEWCVVVRSVPNHDQLSLEPCPMVVSLATLKTELDALDATRYKELSFSASS